MEERERALARVFSFDVKFTGTRKTLFYRRLFGYSSSTKRELKDGSRKTYTHVAQGLLGRIPHVKLGKSVIAVPKAAAGHLEAFFSDPRWQPLELHSFDAILPAEVRARAMEETLASLAIGRERVGLVTEIEELSAAIGRSELVPELAERARHVLQAAEQLIAFDWTDEREFSRRLGPCLVQLRKGAISFKP
ncbi:MAG: hypothetical protein ACE5OT_00080 [Candidatus Hadarchaeaceae archaeon]